MTYRERKETEPLKVLEEIKDYLKYDADPQTRLTMIEKVFFGKKLEDYSIEKFNERTEQWETEYSSIPFNLLEREIYSLKMELADLNLLQKEIYPFWQTIKKDGNSPHKVIWKYYLPTWIFLREQRDMTKPEAANQILRLAKNRFKKTPSQKALITSFDKLHKDFKRFVKINIPQVTPK